MATRPKALINKDVIVFFRQELDLSTEYIASKIKVKEEQYVDWESGDDFPTFKQAEKLANTFKCSIAMFYLPHPPKKYKPNINFRSILLHLSENEKYKLEMNLLEAYRRQGMIKEVYDTLEIKPVKKKLKIQLGDDIETSALKIREMLKVDNKVITKNWNDPYTLVRYWKEIIEENDILVCQTSANSSLSIETNIMRGFCITDKSFPVIVLNSKDAPYGKVFTLIHELCHIVIWGESTINNIDFRDASYDYLDKEEIYCNKLTAEILTPKKQVREYYKKWLNEKEIAKIFWVSQEVVMRRLLDLKFITSKEYTWYRNMVKKIPKKETTGFPKYHIKVINSNGRLFTRAVINAFNDNRISIQNVSQYLNVKSNHLTKIENAVFS